VVSHPLLTPKLVGGFTTQNTDSEWSDARQGQAAELLFWYYNATGSTEYLERAVGSLRASFAVSRSENWAHTGGSEGDVPGAVSGIHWSEGSALTTWELLRDYYRDAYINVAWRNGVGINGCTLSDLSITPPAAPGAAGNITISLTSAYTWTRSLMLTLDAASQPYSLYINNQLLGSYQPTGAPLGIAVPPSVIVTPSTAAADRARRQPPQSANKCATPMKSTK